MTLRVEWELPDVQISDALRERLQAIVKERAVLQLFEEGQVSLGYAAGLLGMGRVAFLDLLAQRGIPFASYTTEDAEADLETMHRLGLVGPAS